MKNPTEKIELFVIWEEFQNCSASDSLNRKKQQNTGRVRTLENKKWPRARPLSQKFGSLKQEQRWHCLGSNLRPCKTTHATLKIDLKRIGATYTWPLEERHHPPTLLLDGQLI